MSCDFFALLETTNTGMDKHLQSQWSISSGFWSKAKKWFSRRYEQVTPTQSTQYVHCLVCLGAEERVQLIFPIKVCDRSLPLCVTISQNPSESWVTFIAHIRFWQLGLWVVQRRLKLGSSVDWRGRGRGWAIGYNNYSRAGDKKDWPAYWTIEVVQFLQCRTWKGQRQQMVLCNSNSWPYKKTLIEIGCSINNPFRINGSIPYQSTLPFTKVNAQPCCAPWLGSSLQCVYW